MTAEAVDHEQAPALYNVTTVGYMLSSAISVICNRRVGVESIRKAAVVYIDEYLKRKPNTGDVRVYRKGSTLVKEMSGALVLQFVRKHCARGFRFSTILDWQIDKIVQYLRQKM